MLVGDLAGEDLHAGEQRGGAVPDLAKGSPSLAGPAAAAGSARSGPAPIPATYRHVQHHAFSGGFRYEPADVAVPGFQLRVGGELDCLQRHQGRDGARVDCLY